MKNYKDIISTFKRSTMLRDLINSSYEQSSPLIITKEILSETLQIEVRDQMIEMCKQIAKKGVIWDIPPSEA